MVYFIVPTAYEDICQIYIKKGKNMRRITGRLTEKGGKWYAVINLYTAEGKRKEKWHNLDLEAKKGRKNSREMLRSIRPYIRSRKHDSFLTLSFCASVRISLVERSSSTVTEKKFAIAFSDSILG